MTPSRTASCRRRTSRGSTGSTTSRSTSPRTRSHGRRDEMRVVAAIAFVLVASLTTTFAQPRGPLRGGPPGQPGRGSAGPTLAERREAIKNRIRGKRAEMLTEKLKLDDKALAKLLPLLSKWDDVTDK